MSVATQVREAEIVSEDENDVWRALVSGLSDTMVVQDEHRDKDKQEFYFCFIHSKFSIWHPWQRRRRIVPHKKTQETAFAMMVVGWSIRYSHIR